MKSLFSTGLFLPKVNDFVMQISYRYQSTNLEMDDWGMWSHEWFSLVTALKICIISRSAKRAIKGVFIPLYVSFITWKWKSNYFYSILEVFHKVLWKIKNRVICPLTCWDTSLNCLNSVWTCLDTFFTLRSWASFIKDHKCFESLKD